MQPKKKGLSRLYFINANGISHHRDLLDFYEILQSMQDNEIDIFGFNETNLNSQQPSDSEKVRRYFSLYCAPEKIFTYV
jgi:hypothetical protein